MQNMMGQTLQRVYKQGNLTFILTPNKTTVQTALGQSFLLEPSKYYKRRYLKIRILIELDEVRSLQELASHTNPGVKWIPCYTPVKTIDNNVIVC